MITPLRTGTGPALRPGMHDLRERYLTACRAYAAAPTEANRLRMEEATNALRVLERGGTTPPPREPVELLQCPRLVQEKPDL